MKLFIKSRLKIATVVYWSLLFYIISALIFWFIALERQNTQMTSYKMQELKRDDPAFVQNIERLNSERSLKSAQYLGEGITFLAVILVGALYVYRAVRRQIKFQQQQSNFMMAVTHELKTPIAVAKLNLETLQKHNLDEPKRQKLLQKTIDEVNRLNGLASNILVSAQLEGGEYNAGKEDIDLSSLVDRVVEDFKHRYSDRDIDSRIAAELDIDGDAFLLQILLSNLIDNAIKYSPRNGAIFINLEKEDQNIALSVADNGPGIPDIEKSRVFEKFYRIGNEETRKAKGTGLGLYLCRKIAKDHNADIRVTDNLPTGTNFIVRFPV